MILQRCAHPRPCYDDGKCHYKGECGHKAPLTNADRIRGMTDDELVNWISDINPFYCSTCVYAKPCRLEYDVETVNYAEKYDCKDGILKWLQKPVEDDKHENYT